MRYSVPSTVRVPEGPLRTGLIHGLVDPARVHERINSFWMLSTSIRSFVADVPLGLMKSHVHIVSIASPGPRAAEVFGFRIAGIPSRRVGLTEQGVVAGPVGYLVHSDSDHVSTLNDAGRRCASGDHLYIELAIGISDYVVNRVTELRG